MQSIMPSNSSGFDYQQPPQPQPQSSFPFVSNDFVVNQAIYTLKQLNCIGEILLKSCSERKSNEKLAKFVHHLPVDAVKQSQVLLRCTIELRYLEQQFQQVIGLLSDLGSGEGQGGPRVFEERYHRELQALWEKCHYALFERTKGSYPQEVQRFRIRKKHPYPPAIWNGDQMKYMFSVKDRAILEKYFDQNVRPNKEEKVKLAERTHLSVKQVTTWFKNRRNRSKEMAETEEDADEDTETEVTTTTTTTEEMTTSSTSDDQMTTSTSTSSGSGSSSSSNDVENRKPSEPKKRGGGGKSYRRRSSVKATGYQMCKC